MKPHRANRSWGDFALGFVAPPLVYLLLAGVSAVVLAVVHSADAAFGAFFGGVLLLPFALIALVLTARYAWGRPSIGHGILVGTAVFVVLGGAFALALTAAIGAGISG